MKASLKLRDDGAASPLLRAKLPVPLFSLPAVASLTAGDPSDLRLSLSTAFPSLPSLRLSYTPNRSSPSPPLSLAVVLGSGPGGCPSSSSSAITMAVEVNTAGAVSFSLVLKPSMGDFSIRKWFDSGSAAAAPPASEVTMRSAVPVRGGAAEVRVRWGVRIPAEVSAGGEYGAAALALRRLPFLVLRKVTVARRPAAAAAAIGDEVREEEKTRRENEKLRRELEELHAEKGTSATMSAAAAAAVGRRSSGWRSPPEMAGGR
uniref:Uncharacterized protein n=1 Tax=Leersia perrieri TaxID=77586 RepID=A0A0D9XBY1_9ORYZ